ncbi:MAG TPA: glycosyltransferase family 4 protein [Caulobacteraceae bacterium]
MRRVIFVNRFYRPDHSATAQILTDLAEFLAREGWDVTVIASRRLYEDPTASLPAKEQLAGVEVRRVWTSRFGRAGLLGRAVDYISFYITAFAALLVQARRGDIVVAKTDPPLLGVAVGLAARLKGARLVNWLQDLYPEVATELGLRLPLSGALKLLRDRSLRSATLNVAIGERMAERVRAARAPVAVAPNWTDDEIIERLQVSPIRGEWGFSPDDFVVGYSGNLGRAHEADTVLGAAQLLRDEPNVRFLFVGGGFHVEDLAARGEAMGLRSLRFQGYQPREQLSQSLAAADVHWLSLRPRMEGLIVPSKFYGIAAAGRPVIAVTDPDGEIARLVRSHACGVVVEPGDSQGFAEAVLRLAEDAAHRHELGARARAMLEARFTRKIALRRWADLLIETGSR